MLKKIREYFSQKGQGTVEYALLLGFVAILTVSLVSSNNLKDEVKTALQNITSQFRTFNAAYSSAS